MLIAHHPSREQVRVERKRGVAKGGCGGVVAANPSQREPGCPLRPGIVRPDDRHLLRQASNFSFGRWRIEVPALQLASRIAVGRESERRGEVGREFHGAIEVVARLPMRLRVELARQRRATQEIVVGIETGDRLALRPFRFSPGERGHVRADYGGGDTILHVEDLFQRAVVTVAPQMCTGRAVDQSAGDTQATPGLADTALEHTARSELASDLGQLVALALPGEACVARHHPQRLEAR